MSIAITRTNCRPAVSSNPAAEGSIRKALADLNVAVRTSTFDLARTRRAELRRTVTDAILLERSVVFGVADLSVFANPAVYAQAETVRLRALGRTINHLIGDAPADAQHGWWIPKMSMIIGDRPGLHMDARDALTARFAR